MALLARLTEVQFDCERRKAVRHNLCLLDPTSPAEGPKAVVILDLSASGLMLETTTPLHVGDTIEVELPRATPQLARVIWARETYFGCEFAEPVSQAVISAALLRSPTQIGRETFPTSATAAPVAPHNVGPPTQRQRDPASPLLTMLSLAVLGAAVIGLMLALIVM